MAYHSIYSFTYWMFYFNKTAYSLWEKDYFDLEVVARIDKNKTN